MINVLVVDDEPIIVNSLHLLLSQTEEWPLTVYKASSAAQALETARNIRVDVMLSDICMPGMDGLELQRRMVNEWPLCRVIFLTGFDSFEYARQAVRQSSTGYVLKVEGDNAILEAVRHSIGEIERDRENRRLLSSAQSALPLLIREFFGELMQSRKVSPEEMEEFLAMANVPLHQDFPVFMLLTFIHPDTASRVTKNDFGLASGVISIIKEYLKDRVGLISIPCPPNVVITLYQPLHNREEQQEWMAAYRRVRETLEEIQESSQRMLGLLTAHVISSEQCAWNDLAAKRSHLDSIVHIYGFDNRSIITDETCIQEEAFCQRSAAADAMVPSPYQLAQLRQFLFSNDETGMLGLLDDFHSMLCKSDIPFSIAKETYYSLALEFLHCINAMDTNIQWTADPELLTHMEVHYSWSKVMEYFAEIGRSIVRSRSSEKDVRNQRLVEQINAYVENHLNEDVSLVSLAEMYHFHPSYLARLYKHFSGETIGQCIVDRKLSHAMKLLSSEENLINDVARNLGFTSAAYFGKFFKTHTGLSPSEYRRNVLTHIKAHMNSLR